MTSNELERINTVNKFKTFDFDLDENLDGILKLASDIYGTPAAFITLIDEHDQWFKVTRGYEVFQMPRATSFCTHVIAQNDVMVVPDARQDIRFIDNPLVANAPNVRFYAGAPLCANDGHNIGTLCVMDTETKEITENQKSLLEILGKQAMHLMELQMTYKLVNEKVKTIEAMNNVLMDIAFIQSHEFRSPVASIIGLMNIIKESGYEFLKEPSVMKESFLMLEEAVAKLDEKVHIVVKSSEDVRRNYLA